MAKQRTETLIPTPIPAKEKFAFLEIIDQAEETNIEKITRMVLRALGITCFSINLLCCLAPSEHD